MSNWSDGYVSEVNYTSGYYKELNPQHFIAPLLMAKIAPPKVVNACELGFGMGISLNIHAAAAQAKWYATDFNPSHALFARHLASSFCDETKMLIADEPFQTFCQRDDLPEFDYIGLHGIWSWITPENRQVIVDFIARKLKVGGVLYISYNTLPGWSSHAPLQHLLSRLYYSEQNIRQNATQGIEASLQKTHDILQLSSGLIQQSPTLLPLAREIKDQNINYIAHEFLNQNWTPMYFAELEEMLSEAKMSFACSACYLDDYDQLLFNEEQQALMNEIQNSSMKQTIKDYLLNSRFRRDFWVKGKRQLSGVQAITVWKQQRVILMVPVKDVSPTLSRKLSTSLNTEYLEALLALLGDHKIHSVNELVEKLPQISEEALCQLLALLISRGEVMIAKSEEEITACYSACRQLNTQIVAELFGANSLNYFASPVTGGAVHLSEIEQLLVYCLWQNFPQEQWVDYVWKQMKRENKIMLRDGQKIDGEQANREEIARLISLFIANKQPIIEGLRLL